MAEIETKDIGDFTEIGGPRNVRVDYGWEPAVEGKPNAERRRCWYVYTWLAREPTETDHRDGYFEESEPFFDKDAAMKAGIAAATKRAAKKGH